MLGRLLSAFGAAAVRTEVGAIVGHIKLRAMLLTAAGVLWVLAFAFALGAFTVWLAGLVGTIAACLILAVVFAAAGAGLYIWQMMAKRQATPLTSLLSQAIAPLKQAAEDEAAAAAARTAAPEPPDGEAPPSDHAAREAGSVGAILVLATFGYAIGRSLTER